MRFRFCVYPLILNKNNRSFNSKIGINFKLFEFYYTDWCGYVIFCNICFLFENIEKEK